MPPIRYNAPMTLDEESEDLVFPDGGCFGCSASNPVGLHLRFRRRGDAVYTPYTIPDVYHGAPGIAHGGILATIIDEVSCAAVAFVEGSYVVTGELTVRYLRPCPVETPLEISARIVARHARYLVVDAEVRRDGELLARSTGRFFPQARTESAP
jgi:acyl-coenzyme A thioesterase PaaI-like protein